MKIHCVKMKVIGNSLCDFLAVCVHNNQAPFTRQRCQAKMKKFLFVLAHRLHQTMKMPGKKETSEDFKNRDFENECFSRVNTQK